MLYFGQLKKIIRSTGIYTGMTIFNNAVSFFMLPVLTRFLTPFHYGILATFQAIYPMGESFIDMGSNSAISVRYFDREDKTVSFSRYVFNAIIVKLLFAAIFSLILFLFWDYLVKKYNFPPWLIIIIPVISFASAFIGMLRALFIVQKKALAYSFFQSSRTLMSIGLSLLFIVIIGMHWDGRILGILITELLFAVICLVYLLRNNLFDRVLDTGAIKKIIIFGTPLFIYGIGRWVNNLADRFFLTSMLDISVTGVYSVGYSVASVLEFISGGVGLAVMPLLFNKLQNPTESQKRSIVRYTYFYFFIMFILTLAWIFLSRIFLRFFVGKEFIKALEFIPLISVAYFFNTLFRMFSWYIQYAKKTYYLTYAVIIAAVVNLILNYYLIKANGAMGAAQSTCISFVINALLTWFFAQRVYPMPWFSFSVFSRS